MHWKMICPRRRSESAGRMYLKQRQGYICWIRCLGFGSEDTIEPPTNKFLKSGTMVYQYKIKQLVKRDVIFLNSLLLDYADLFFGYANADKVRTNNKMKCNKVWPIIECKYVICLLKCKILLKQNEYRYDKNIIWLPWQCLMDREKSLILQRFLDEGIEFTPLEHRIVIVKIVVTV